MKFKILAAMLLVLVGIGGGVLSLVLSSVEWMSKGVEIVGVAAAEKPAESPANQEMQTALRALASRKAMGRSWQDRCRSSPCSGIHEERQPAQSHFRKGHEQERETIL